MVVVAVPSNASCCARSSTAADHTVHGDARPELRASKACAAAVGATCTRWISVSRSAAPGARDHAQQFDLFAAAIAGVLVVVLALFFNATRTGSRCARWPTTNRRAGGRHPAAGASGASSGRLRPRRAGRRPAVGGAPGGAVLIVAGGAQSDAGTRARRIRFDRRRNRRRPGGRRYRKLAESILGSLHRRRHRLLVRLSAALAFLLIRPSGLFGAKLIQRV